MAATGFGAPCLPSDEMWPLLGVAFLSMLLPLALKLVQKWRARHGMDAA